MKDRLSEFISRVSAKRLSAVEADVARSNQHEFNGVNSLKPILGEAPFQRRPTKFIWLGGEDEVVRSDSWLTWYDAREKHPTRSEWRLYFPSNEVMQLAAEGATLFVLLPPDNQLTCVLCEDDTIAHQLLWLFKIDTADLLGFEPKGLGGINDRNLGFSESWILEALGFELESSEDIDLILDRFGDAFPTTRHFSDFARELEGEFKPGEHSPDEKLIAFLTREESLFRTFERHLIEERLTTGFLVQDQVDVDGFISFSLSVQNRRKSRAGYSLENHMQAIFEASGIPFQRGAQTENRKKPDFLFPGQAEYHNPDYPESMLLMLGAKSTCKDRWRQVLSEAARISVKHLLTVEPSISKNQTDEMRASNLQLVVPRAIQETYLPDQCDWLIGFEDFIKLATPSP